MNSRCFSQMQVIASVGLDKKLYAFDSGSRKLASCISYDASFSSLAFRDDGWILVAGTSNGRVVFYDVRGKPQPLVELHAYGNSEKHHFSHFVDGGNLTRLHAPRNYNFKDNMEEKKDHLRVDKKPSLLFPSSNRRFPLSEEGGGSDHPIFDWKPSSTSKRMGSELFGYKYFIFFLYCFGFPSAPLAISISFSATSQTSMSYLTSSNLISANLRNRDNSSNQESSLGFPEHIPFSSMSLSLGTKSTTSGQSNLDSLGSALNHPRKFTTYAERMSTNLAFSDGTSLSVGSPKTKKTGAETREELLNSLLSRTDTLSATEQRTLPYANGGVSQPPRIPSQPHTQQRSSFTLQLFQHTLEETLGSFQKSIHEDMRNLHIEILRQFHMQE
ncbi:Protein NEDD1, partial [Camellia lanceoleosa]